MITSGYKGFKFTPAWPPDSKKLAWADKDLRLWYADINDKKQVEVDHGEYNEITNYSWSPDSRWIAYDKQLESGLSVVSSSMSSRTQREPIFLFCSWQRLSRTVFIPGWQRPVSGRSFLVPNFRGKP